jgi:hypothetical protein
LDAGSGFGSRNAKINEKNERKGIYFFNNWIFSLDGWREDALEALQKYFAILYQNVIVIFLSLKALVWIQI